MQEIVSVKWHTENVNTPAESHCYQMEGANHRVWDHVGRTTHEWASPIFPGLQLEETQCWSMGTERQPSAVELVP
ncbi:hypothetical protein PBY51_023848 [Eleginops maclovinus]|uniref:Uncharacterized protein n=1 Tax=Eleginops maclovinus TaxID=56733 RepID=A0AAN7WUL2_ELEMC|nr:hypothetical protein PBY51_023848 [Eleginops maclovinus]